MVTFLSIDFYMEMSTVVQHSYYSNERHLTRSYRFIYIHAQIYETTTQQKCPTDGNRIK